MEFPTIDKFAKEVAEKALDEITYEGKTVREWVEIIVKQRSSEDCISRQAVIEGLANIAKAKAKSDAQKSMMGRCMFFVEQLPPVTPQRPKGKWNFIGYQMFECSSCKSAYTQNQFEELRLYTTDDLLPKFCPNCGAEMSGGGEE